MCEYCGCRQNPAIGQLMDEHDQLLTQIDAAQRALANGDGPALERCLAEFSALLTQHTGLEERGIFAAMVTADEFTETIEQLTEEHRSLDRVLARLDTTADDLADQLAEMARDLAEHIDKENNGIFPASVVSLHPQEWAIVEQAHAQQS
ncbi:MAG TPA: hemerythrin domain-containing protein [Candidatus Avipropionibacterium avicola]|uniref:Hemerythrin domain-containing protein n=1 Tax=Candidatus Avipropionibacterium avicola TaxID=2840701 RepID=A0A9D1H2S2_9ACTN|nr:hemerythrin domain-containing protein [Candidatus Avipropionibacterium avicola]